jgi:hypothetical protein
VKSGAMKGINHLKSVLDKRVNIKKLKTTPINIGVGFLELK